MSDADSAIGTTRTPSASNGSCSRSGAPDQPTHTPPAPCMTGPSAVTRPPGDRVQLISPSEDGEKSTGSRLATTTRSYPRSVTHHILRVSLRLSGVWPATRWTDAAAESSKTFTLTAAARATPSTAPAGARYTPERTC